MKFGIVLAFLGCISAAFAASCCYDRCKYTEGHNGRFTCAAGDVGKDFRNNNDPTKYWTCTAAGQPAECRSCQTEWLFHPVDRKCVCFDEWLWSAPCDPLVGMITDASGCEACIVPGTGTGAGCTCGSGNGAGGAASCGCNKSA